MATIHWFDNETVEDAVTLAKETSKPLVVDFWDPGCRGCAKLFTTTYPDPRVHALGDDFVWIKYSTRRPNTWFQRLNGQFGHHWHPDVVVLDHHLKEVRRVIGFLPAPEFVPQLAVGRALAQIYNRAFGNALITLASVLAEYPMAVVAPEALYWAGVAGYRTGGEEQLSLYWSRLAIEYPASEWCLKADCLDVVIPDHGFSIEDPTSITLHSDEIAHRARA